MIKLTQLLKEITINTPGVTSIKVTDKSYKDVNADILTYLIYDRSQISGASSYYNDSLQNVIKLLKENPNNLYGGTFEFDDLYQYMSGVISEIYEDTLTKAIIFDLVNLYNNDQKLLEYILESNNASDYWQAEENQPYIENNKIIDPSDGEELITLEEIKKNIEEILLPFVTLYNQLENNYTIGYGDYMGEKYLIKTYENGIEYYEPIWDKNFNRVLGDFNKRGYIVFSNAMVKENPEVF